jgi:hypothetical protein
MYFPNLEITAFFRAFGSLDDKKTILSVAKSDNLLLLTICYIGGGGIVMRKILYTPGYYNSAASRHFHFQRDSSPYPNRSLHSLSYLHYFRIQFQAEFTPNIFFA